MIDEDLQSACLQRRDVYTALTPSGMEGCRGLSAQGLGTARHDAATNRRCRYPALHRPAYLSSNASIQKTSLPHRLPLEGTGSSGHIPMTTPSVVCVPCLHQFGWEVVVQARLLVAFCNISPSIHCPSKMANSTGI